MFCRSQGGSSLVWKCLRTSLFLLNEVHVGCGRGCNQQYLRELEEVRLHLGSNHFLLTRSWHRCQRSPLNLDKYYLLGLCSGTCRLRLPISYRKSECSQVEAKSIWPYILGAAVIVMSRTLRENSNSLCLVISIIYFKQTITR